jgi:hypothetical protein
MLLKSGAGILLTLTVYPALLRCQDRASALFGSEEVEEIRIFIHPSDWARLKARYLDNEYYPALLEWRSHSIENIGVRSRGNGSRSPVKPSLRIDFNRYDSQEFLGLTGLTLINLNQDPPMLRDYLSTWLFRECGAPAPRETYVALTVNGESMGLYLAAEEIAKPFLKRYFGEEDGDLFEYDWAREWHWESRGGNPAEYVPRPFSPKTHELNPNSLHLVRLIETVNQDEVSLGAAGFDSSIDLDNWMRHWAIEWYLAELDGFWGAVGTNNFYLYRARRDSLWRLIAWDKSDTLAWYECPPGWRAGLNAVARRVLADPLLRARFLEILREVAARAEGMEALAERVWARIRDAALSDVKKPYSNEVLEQSVIDTLFFLRVRREYVALHGFDEESWRPR